MSGLILAVVLASGMPHAESEEVVTSMERRAIAASGDSRVALELFEYYMEGNDAINSLFWIRVAAEQGNCRAVVEYGRTLGAGMHRREEQDFWLGRATDLNCDHSRAGFHPKARDER